MRNKLESSPVSCLGIRLKTSPWCGVSVYRCSVVSVSDVLRPSLFSRARTTACIRASRSSPPWPRWTSPTAKTRPASRLQRKSPPAPKVLEREPFKPQLRTPNSITRAGWSSSTSNALSLPVYVCSGMPYPVGIVPPRAKSPITESSSIASFVTLRKSKKPDPRTVSASHSRHKRYSSEAALRESPPCLVVLVSF